MYHMMFPISVDLIMCDFILFSVLKGMGRFNTNPQNPPYTPNISTIPNQLLK